MRSRASSKSINRRIQVEKPKFKEEPHLSGAFIRSLVRQLSSSKTKEAMNHPSSSDGKVGDGSSQNFTKSSEVDRESQQLPPPRQPRQPKKQVRRRFHTSRPYQEKLLNMAEARREIVAALKFHRATMRKASDMQKHQQNSAPKEVPSSLLQAPLEESHVDKKYRRSQTTTTSFDHLNKSPDFSWAYNSISRASISENLKFILPKPPLGLNLNFHDFENLETTFYCSSNGSPSPHFLSSPSATMTSSSASSASSTSSYSCSSSITMSVAEVPLKVIKPIGVSEATSEPSVESWHPVMDDKEIEEIRSISERHSVEWNDRLNSVHSAWWCKFFKTVEAGSQIQEENPFCGVENGLGLMDEAISFPPWLSDQQKLYGNGTEAGFLEDSSLPCLDIGEIEGIDGEWLL